MLLDAYLKFDGPDVPGESADAQHADQIKILSLEFTSARGEFALGQADPGSNRKTVTLATSAPKFEPIRILKQLDKSTPKLLGQFTNSKSFDKATISCCLPDPTPRSTKKIDYLEITLETVQIIRYSLVGNPAAFRTREGAVPFTDSELGNMGPVDEFELVFQKFELLYRGADGKSNLSMSFDAKRGH